MRRGPIVSTFRRRGEIREGTRHEFSTGERAEILAFACPAALASFVVDTAITLAPKLLYSMATKPSPYLLIFRDVSSDTYKNLSADERQRLMQLWNEWYDGLAAEGKVKHGHPLECHGRIVSGSRGERIVDGPFAEAHEAIGGYFLLSVADIDEATAIAQRCPSLPLGMIVEVRAVAEICPALRPREPSEGAAAMTSVLTGSA